MAILKRLLPLLLVCAAPAMGEAPEVTILGYHDVRDQVSGDYDPDQFAVSTARLIDQFTWLRDNGYQVVSVDQLIDARDGVAPLPDKAVLLSFDDGLVSVYTHVLPLLKLFDYPAVVSVVTNWIETDEVVKYAEKERTREDFLNWDQIRELVDSGLVEISSHSHDMHRGVLGNPQGNTQPAAVTRRYDGSAYESEAEYRQRIHKDLSTSVALIKENTGIAPRVMTWPYGAHNKIVSEVARDNGMPIGFTLDPFSEEEGDVLRMGRHLLIANPPLAYFSADVAKSERAPVIRVAQVDLDQIYDPDPKVTNANLSKLLDRIKDLKISHVYLQAFADLDGDGGADAVYFENRHLPVRADLFSHVAWQLKTRAEVLVYAWLPLLSYVGGPFDPEWRVLEYHDGEFRPDPDSEPRLSPFNENARRYITEIYEDLAIHTDFDGVLFHDDGRLSDAEDFSPSALRFYEENFEEPITPEMLADDAELRQRWTDLKTHKLRAFSLQLMDQVHVYHPGAKSVRNIFAGALLSDSGTNDLAQNFDAYLATYDFVALMAMPSLEGVSDHQQFYSELVEAVSQRKDGLERTIFGLQAFDWRNSRPVDSEELRTTMRWLQSLGVRNLGYYPDNFMIGLPDFDDLRQGISLNDDLLGGVH